MGSFWNDFCQIYYEESFLLIEMAGFLLWISEKSRVIFRIPMLLHVL